MNDDNPQGTFPPMRGRYRLIGVSPYNGRRIAVASRSTREQIENRQRWYERLGYTELAIIPPAEGETPAETDERSTT